jgi:hypothetical protein
MTLLGNDVLVCGGFHLGVGFLSSCNLYKASINKWAAAATISALPDVMNKFTMITLHTRPYVFGGNAGGFLLNTVYTLDTSNVWTARTPMIFAVYSHTAVALATNTALVCGGWVWGMGWRDSTHPTPALSACSSYSATNDVWSPAAQMNTARYGHGMAVYKGLFVPNRGIIGGCAQIACLSMAELAQT